MAGVDTRLRLTSNDDLDVQWLTSQAEYPSGVAAENGQPAGIFEDNAFRARYQHSRRDWNIRANYTDIGDDFRADLGFMPRVGYRQIIAGGGYEWFGDDEKWYTSIELRLIYQFNRRTFVRLIGQASKVDRDPSHHADEVDPSVEDIFGQLLGYTSGYLDVAGSGLTETDNTLFLKFGYNWQP